MTSKFVTLALLTLVLLTGCDSNDMAAPRATTAPFAFFSDPSTHTGTSTLTRTDDAVSMTLETGDFPEGTALTVWWAIFNDPASCSDGVCSLDDVFEDAVTPRTTVVYATGGVVGNSGTIRYNATLREGGPTGQIIVGPTGTQALEDAESAEVHLVVRSHGPAIPGQVEAQTTTFGGGCLEERGATADPSVEGECGDLLFAIHLP